MFLNWVKASSNLQNFYNFTHYKKLKNKNVVYVISFTNNIKNIILFLLKFSLKLAVFANSKEISENI